MKITVILTLLFCCMIAASCATRQSAIVNVRVLNSNFDEIKVFGSPEEINSFTNLWFNRKSVERTPPFNWTHKIDITTETGNGGRWLYSTNGRCALLCYQLKPMYMLKNPKDFNVRIGSP